MGNEFKKDLVASIFESCETQVCCEVISDDAKLYQKEVRIIEYNQGL